MNPGSASLKIPGSETLLKDVLFKYHLCKLAHLPSTSDYAPKQTCDEAYLAGVQRWFLTTEKHICMPEHSIILKQDMSFNAGRMCRLLDIWS